MSALRLDFRIAKNRRAAVNLVRHISDARTLAARAELEAKPMGPTVEREAKGDIVAVPLRDLHPSDKTNRKTKRVRVDDSLAAFDLPADSKAAAEHYREAYEDVHASGRSKDIPRPGAGIQAARTTITDHMADASSRLHRLDRIVGPQCAPIVRSVVGEGMSMRTVRPNSRSRKLATARLRMGLARLARWLAS